MSGDLLTILREDHRLLEELLVELAVLSGGEPLRRTLSHQTIIEFVRHSMIEEVFLYPVLSTVLSSGAGLTDRVRDYLSDSGPA